MKILFPDLSYNDSLFVCNLERLDSRREQIVRDLFNEIKNPAHVLHNILPGKLSTSTSVTTHKRQLSFRITCCQNHALFKLVYSLLHSQALLV
jgi:hypothetical protein